TCSPRLTARPAADLGAAEDIHDSYTKLEPNREYTRLPPVPVCRLHLQRRVRRRPAVQTPAAATSPPSPATPGGGRAARPWRRRGPPGATPSLRQRPAQTAGRTSPALARSPAP